MDRDTYRFAGQEVCYNLFRPNWSPVFAIQSLRGAGIYKDVDGAWIGTPLGNPPVVVSIGAGTGADAAEFKKLGCRVILVEPNAALLSIAKVNMAKVPEGAAEFYAGNAVNTKIPDGIKIDLIVVAQAAHTLKQAYSEQYMSEELKRSGKGAEELAREHFATLLPADDRKRLSIWYYNPDPEQEMTQELHSLLLENCPAYAKSKTPLLNAEYFNPNHFQSWMSAEQMEVSGPIPSQIVSLTRDDIGQWLNSYSFKPDADNFARVVRILQEQWFDKYQKNGVVEIEYLGAITQAPLRGDTFLMAKINDPIAAPSPLAIGDLERPEQAAPNRKPSFDI